MDICWRQAQQEVCIHAFKVQDSLAYNIMYIHFHRTISYAIAAYIAIIRMAYFLAQNQIFITTFTNIARDSYYSLQIK